MIRIIDYTDTDRASIIASQKTAGFRVQVDQRHFDGNRLIFTDSPIPPPSRDLAAEVDSLKERVKILEPRLPL